MNISFHLCLNALSVPFSFVTKKLELKQAKGELDMHLFILGVTSMRTMSPTSSKPAVCY